MKRTRKSRLSKPYAVVAFAVFCTALMSPPGEAHAQYAATLWTTSSGLPENLIHATLATEAGLWVAGAGGLSIFDGSHFSTLGEQELHSLSVNSFSCLTRTHDGRVWAGTEGGGLVSLNPGRVRVYGERDGLASLYIRVLFEDSSRRLWVGTDDGLFLFKDTHFERVYFSTKKEPAYVVSLAEDVDHRILIGGARLYAMDSSGSRLLRIPESDSINQINAMIVARDSSVWAATYSGLYHERNGQFTRVAEVHVRVTALAAGRDGTVWIGTAQHGVITYKNGVFSDAVTPDSSASRLSITNISEDSDERIWAATQSGVMRLIQTPERLFPRTENSSSLKEAAKTHPVWIGADNVVQIPKAVPLNAALNSLQERNILAALSGRDNSLWLAMLATGVYHLTPSELTHYSTRSGSPISSDFARGLLETSQGDLWVATGYGLDRIHKGVVTRFGTSEGLPNQNVRSLAEDRYHCIWIGTEGGVAYRCPGQFQSNAITAALKGEKVWTILIDRMGSLWFGTRDHGVYRVDTEGIIHLTTAVGFPSNSIYSFLQDRDGRFWISAAEGIFSFAENDLERADIDGAKPISVTGYEMPTNDGGSLPIGGRFPSGFLGADRSLWFACQKGAIRVDPTPAHVNALPPVEISSVAVDALPIAIRSNLTVKPTAIHLAFALKTIYLGQQEDLGLFYRLRGLDDTWIQAPQTRIVEYRNLPAGSYEFEARLFLRSDPSHFHLARVSVTKPPIWYRTKVFIISCIVFAALILLAGYWARLRSLRSRFEAILQERNRVAREMHDTLIQGCNGVAMLLEAAAEKDSESEDPLLSLARIQIRQTVQEARDAVWDLRHTEMDANDLNGSLRSLTSQASEATGLPVMFSSSAFVPKISAFDAHEILMIVREAIANAANHASPTRIEVAIAAISSGSRLEVAICDDGCGFDRTSLPLINGEHFGILGMEERANRIEAELHICKREQGGTAVTLKCRPYAQLNHAVRGETNDK